MGAPLSLLLHDLLGRIRAGGAAERAPPSRPSRRPPGKLAWFHLSRARDLPALAALTEALSEQMPGLGFLVTTDGPRPEEGLPDSCLHEVLPPDRLAPAREFLSFWSPDVLAWISARLAPAILHETARAGIPRVLLDTGAAFELSRRWPYPPLLVRRTLRGFDAILSGDEATSLALIAAGARRERVQTIGVLEREVQPLPCNQAEWDAMTELLATRPVWLAAGIVPAELGPVIRAHRQVLRRAHRLLLIIVPARIADSDSIAGALAVAGVSFARRSRGEDPGRDTPVYLADTEDELGLWYRLSPVSFIGRTLSECDDNPDPLQAAVLGSVVVHGPWVTAHRVAFRRLARAGASREVKNAADLAGAIDALLAPDRAAVMAHAAWQISSAGAEAIVRAADALAGRLGPARSGGS